METPQRSRPIYLDHHATTPVDPRVAAVVLHWMVEAFGNANSAEHAYGLEARTLVARSREEIASLVGGDPHGVHFTSGSTEAVRLGLEVLLRNTANHPIAVVPRTEHRAVISAVAAHEAAGRLRIRWLDVDRDGRLDLQHVASSLTGAQMLCVMAANNEVGTVHPIQEIAEIARASGVRLLVDATQAAGRTPICSGEWGIDFLAVSAHKIYGPKGVGALIATPGVVVRPESGTPGTGPGTPNVPGIAGFGEASRLRRLEGPVDEPRIAALRDRLEARLLAEVPDVRVNGDRRARLSGNLHLSVAGVPGEALIAQLLGDVALSTGAACTSGAPEPSHVLRAMGLEDIWIEGALRMGIGRGTTSEDVEIAADRISAAVARTRRLLGYETGPPAR